MTQSRFITLPTEEIEAVATIQVRRFLDPKTIDEYAEAWVAGAKFPAIVVYAERGSERYLLADGFHRLAAATAAGIVEIMCDVREGGVHEALKHALGANDEHGLRRNNKDKRNAVELALKDPEWGTWSAADIAALCRVSAPLVVKVREDMVLAGKIGDRDTVQTIRDGKVVERKAISGTRLGSSSKNLDERDSSTKSTPQPKRPGPKSQDQIDREEFDAALLAINSQVHDEREKVRRWYSVDRKRQASLAVAYLQGFVTACEEIEKKNAA